MGSGGGEEMDRTGGRGRGEGGQDGWERGERGRVRE